MWMPVVAHPHPPVPVSMTAWKVIESDMNVAAAGGHYFLNDGPVQLSAEGHVRKTEALFLEIWNILLALIIMASILMASKSVKNLP